MSDSPRIAVLIPPALREQIMPSEAMARLENLGSVTWQEGKNRPSAEEAKALLADAELCVGSWGMPRLDADLLDAAPRLRFVAYAAGSVKAFATEAMWDRGIRVASGMPAIAQGVADFVVGVAVLGRRDAFRRSMVMRGETVETGSPREVWGATIGLISLGIVGRATAEMLRPFGPRLIAWDPFVSAEAMAGLGIEKVELDDLLRRSDIVSLHTPSLPTTQHMLSTEQFAAMKEGALFLNTARGAVVDEDALLAALQTGRITACLDVTDPEPPAPDSPLRSLPNVFLTPHIAGPPTPRLGLLAAEEVERYLNGSPLVCEMTRQQMPYTS